MTTKAEQALKCLTDAADIARMQSRPGWVTDILANIAAARDWLANEGAAPVRMPKVEAALDWAYRNGYTPGSDLAAKEYATATGTIIMICDNGLYADSLAFVPVRDVTEPKSVAGDVIKKDGLGRLSRSV